MLNKERFIKMCRQIVETYTFEGVKNAVEKVELLRNPTERKVCRCRNCIMGSIKQANEWITFAAGDYGNEYHYHLENGKIIGGNDSKTKRG